jgi:hypothetical protein
MPESRTQESSAPGRKWAVAHAATQNHAIAPNIRCIENWFGGLMRFSLTPPILDAEREAGVDNPLEVLRVPGYQKPIAFDGCRSNHRIESIDCLAYALKLSINPSSDFRRRGGKRQDFFH